MNLGWGTGGRELLMGPAAPLRLEVTVGERPYSIRSCRKKVEGKHDLFYGTARTILSAQTTRRRRKVPRTGPLKVPAAYKLPKMLESPGVS